ncbi:riboflavin-binding protein-like [Rhopilema esculentum]|uniref:riboflavin-binding protein-like n=1 Tax=Rhopilema esculentum TaxID=499914 RepID=UPI0031D57F3A|eukprot:gene14871-6002_t
MVNTLPILLVLLVQISYIACQEQCINGKFHKNSPGPESGQYMECHPWKNKTCCTAAFTKEFAANQTKQLYGHDWHRCKNLSAACERFWINQECFYQCSPYVYKWKATEGKPPMEVVKGVPICASACDRWYQACKFDQICVENVLADYNFTEHGENLCPKDKPCKTYEKMYGSGKALCEKMWGSSYVYTKENSESSNCMVMWFAGQNPNRKVAFVAKHPSYAVRIDTATWILLLAQVIAVLPLLS